MLNSREIGLLRSDVADNCRRWLERCRSAGLQVLVTSTVRDREYQEWLYEQGRTRPGSIITNGRVPTFHGVKAGLAFDFCKNIKGHEYDDPAFFRRAAGLAKEMGFSWGGDWHSFPDTPHIQWDAGGSYTGAMIRRGEYPPDMPHWEEDEALEQERFDHMLEDWLKRQQTLDAGEWSKDARQWAEKNELIRGDETGVKQYKAFITREQAVVLLNRLYEMLREEGSR